MEEAYWNRFYSLARHDIEAPSSFATWCLERLTPDLVLFELGCGNGRDALFFAGKGLRVVACDTSEITVEKLAARAGDARFRHRPTFAVWDMSALPRDFHGEIDAVYSRFTLHAVTRPTASGALAWSAAAIRPGGRLFIEARSVAGSLFGVGLPAERDAFIHQGHYRRFLRKEELVAELEELGFRVEQVIEASGLAVYGDDDPVVLRVIAERPA